MVMAGSRRKFDHDFRQGAIRIVKESQRPIAQIARELGVNEGTLGNWVTLDREAGKPSDGRLSESVLCNAGPVGDWLALWLRRSLYCDAGIAVTLS